MKKTKKLKAIDYIRKGWTKSAYARTELGRVCEVDSPKAVKWCASGAITAAYGEHAASAAAYHKLQKIVGDYISIWNDKPKRTKKQVLAAFEKAGI